MVKMGILLSGVEAYLSCVLEVKDMHLNHFEQVIKEMWSYLQIVWFLQEVKNLSWL